MIKVIALITRRPGLSREEFLAYWSSEHAGHVRRLPGIRRYRQNHPLPHKGEWPFDGAAEVWFDTKDDVRIAFASPEADAMREDEKNFIGGMTWFLAEEMEIPLSPNPEMEHA